MKYLLKPAILNMSIIVLICFTAASFAQEMGEPRATEGLTRAEVMPQVIEKAQPKYPIPAMEQKIQGEVIVRSLVDKTGEIAKVEIARSSGNKLLDKAAVMAAEKAKYKPGMQNGQPVPVWVSYAINFDLSREEGSEAIVSNEFTSVDVMPIPIYRHNPEYPEEAKAKKLTGKVTIKALIGKDGIPEKVSIAKSSGHEILDEAARAAALKCRYKAGMQDGLPAAVWIKYDIEFNRNRN